jgi:subtilisin family serine protease
MMFRPSFVSAVALCAAAAQAAYLPAPAPLTQNATAYAPTQAGEDVPPEKALEQLPYVPGRLILELKPSLDVCLDCLIERRQPLASVLGSSSLDELNRRHGLRTARPLRRGDAAIRSVAERRQRQEARRERMLQHAGVRRRLPPLTGTLPDLSSIYVLELAPWLDMEAVAREYASDPDVEYAEPDRKVQAAFVPNDPFFASSRSWGQTFDDLWGLKLIEAPAAWDVSRGAGVVVAVTDTGVDYFHPDLAANMWVNPGEIPLNLMDDDGNGYVDDINGWDFVSDDAEPFDDHGHGTHVAGTIAAVGQNGVGVVGVAWQSKIMALKGLNSAGGGTVSDLAEAIVYAAENGADVINASWGGVGSSQTIDDALAITAAAGVVFVAAAGNNNSDVELNLSGPFFPASNAHAITVSAFDHLDQRAFFSNFGRKIDVAAPGGGDEGTGYDPYRSILSLRSSAAGSDMTGGGRLVVQQAYLRQAGTSMAAPHVAGAAAVILAAHPGFGPEQVRQALRAGADDVAAPGLDLNAGYGRLNVGRSVAIEALGVRIRDPQNGFVAAGTEVVFSGVASGAGFTSYSLEYGAGAFPTSWTMFAGPMTAPVDDGPLAIWDISDVPDGDYTVRLRAISSSGDAFEDRVAVRLDHVMLTAPMSNTIRRAGGPIEIHGTAAGGDFQHFRVEWRRTRPDYVSTAWSTNGMTPSGGGSSPVTDGVLATFDSSQLTDNADVDFRVVVRRTVDEASEEVRHVILDPSLRPGWPQVVPGLPQFSGSLRMIHNVTLADLDADGTKEILTAYGDMVYVFRHDGTLMPGWPQALNAGSGTPFIKRSPAAADLDGDGRLEVVAAAETAWYLHGDEWLYVWHHDGTAKAGWPKRFHHAFARDPDDPNIGGGPRGDFALADVDGDGRRDIVAVIGPALYVINADGNVLPGWPQQWPRDYPCLLTQRCYAPLIAVGDVNGNGKREIAAITADVRRGSGDGEVLLLYSSTGRILPGFPQKVANKYYGPLNGHLNGYSNAPIMADLDGDGDLEIITMTNAMKLRAYHHTGKRARLQPNKAAAAENLSCGSRFPSRLEPPTAGDLDGDGRADIIVASHLQRNKWRRSGRGVTVTFCLAPTMRGTDYLSALSTGRSAIPGGWPVGISFPAGDNSYGPGPAAIGDIDGDLLPEVVSASGICGQWDQQLGLAGHRCFTINAYDRFGRLLPGFPKATPGPGTHNSITPAIGDLDGDGRKEIVWIDFFGHVLVWDVPGPAAPEAMQWPMFRHDAAHTGALVAVP